MMKLTILGSCSAYPTLDRFTTSQILQINGKSFLIDCGEGTQIQLRNNKIKFNLLYDKNRGLQKKIKSEQIRRETSQ